MGEEKPFDDGSEGEESGVVLCACGAIEEDDGVMVECVKCRTWQHVHCVGLTSEEAEANPAYLCHNCDPDAYNKRVGGKAPVTPASLAKKPAPKKSSTTTKTPKTPAVEKTSSEKKTSTAKQTPGTKKKKKMKDSAAEDNFIPAPSPSPLPPPSPRPGPTLEEEQEYELYQQGPSLMELYATSAGQNHRNLVDVRNEVQLHRLQNPPLTLEARPSTFRRAYPDKKRTLFASVLQTDLPFSSVAAVAGKRAPMRWVVQVTDTEKLLRSHLDNNARIPQGDSRTIWFELSENIISDKAMAKRLGDEIRDICERLPISEPKQKQHALLDGQTRKAIVAAASTSGIAGDFLMDTRAGHVGGKIDHDSRRTVAEGREKNEPKAHAFVDHWSPNGLETPVLTTTKIFEVSILGLAESNSPPPLYPASFGMHPITPFHDSPDVNIQQSQAALEVIWWIQSVLYHRVITAEGAIAYARSLLEMLGHPAFDIPQARLAEAGMMWSTALYADRDLYTVKRDSGDSEETHSLLPSELAVREVAFRALPTIVLPKTGIALYRVKEALESAWIETGNVHVAWEIALRRADFELELVEDPQQEVQDRCFHTAAEAEYGTHLCDSCYLPTRHIDFKMVGPLRICTRASCGQLKPQRADVQLKPRGADADAKKPKRRRERHLARLARIHGVGSEKYAHHALRQRIRGLCTNDKLTGLSKKERSKLVTDIQVDLRQTIFFSDGQLIYIDAYTGEQRKLVFRAPQEPSSPFDHSIDRIYPCTLENGKLRFHAPGNVTNCAIYLNFLKHTYPPIILKLVRELQQAEAGAVRSNLLNMLHHQHLIVTQLHHNKSRTQTAELDEESLAALRVQWQTGDFLAASPKAKGLRLGVGQRLYEVMGTGRSLLNLHGNNPNIDGINIDWLEDRISEMEDHFDERIERISDVPYPFLGGLKPSAWTWGALIAVFTARLRTMTQWCNKSWRKRTSVERMIATYCRQFLDPEWKGDCLGIPLVPIGRSPGSLSAGKLRHKQEMLDGWPQAEGEDSVPLSSISSDDFDPAQCNINFESWITNRMKGPVEWEPFLDEMLQNIGHVLDDNPPHWPKELQTVSPPPTEFPLTVACEGCDRKGLDCSEYWPCEKCMFDGKICIPSPADADETTMPIETAVAQDAAQEARVGQKSALKGPAKGKSAASRKTDSKGKAQTAGPPKSGPKSSAPPPPTFPLAAPPYKNLTNLGGTCYLASPLQWFARIHPLRKLLNDPSNFPCTGITGRRDGEWKSVKDESGTKHLQLVQALLDLVLELDEEGNRVSEDFTSNVLKRISALNPEFQNRENDTGDLFSWLLETLNRAGDGSASRLQYDAEGKRLRTPLEAYQHEQDDRIRAGDLVLPLEQERKDQYDKYLDIGNKSPITDLFAIQIVRENECPAYPCTSPYSRSWEVACILQLAFPMDDRGEDDLYTMKEILLAWQTETYSEGMNEGVECLSNKDHPRRKLSERKIVRTPKLLAIRLGRVGLQRNCNVSPIQGDLEGAADIITARLHLEEYLDLFEFCDFKLPSEIAYAETMEEFKASKLLTVYRLVGAVQFRNRHYVSYVRV